MNTYLFRHDRQRYLKCVVACLLTVLVSANSAFATTLQFSGVVTDLSGSAGSSSLYGLAEVGDVIQGSFSYEPSAVTDSNSWDVVGRYNFNESNSHMSLSIYDQSAGGSLLYTYDGRLSYILTQDNLSTAGLTIDAFTPVGLLDNGSNVFLRYQNRDTNLGVITNDLLPVVPPAFEDFNFTTGSITIPSVIGQVDFNLSELTVVPLPPAIVMFFSALISCVTVAKKKSKRV